MGEAEASKPSPPGPAVTVIVATYDQPRALERVLAGYARQREKNFELIVADDGSGPETRAIVERAGAVHVWQENTGFRKARIVNEAFRRSRGSTVIFSDGDCVPPADFVGTHLAAAGPNTFCVGGYVPLTPEQSAVFNPDLEKELWTGHLGRLRRVHLQNLFYIACGARRRPKTYGCNLSVDRMTFEAVNGFDENFDGFGKEDSDLRNRLVAYGARPVSLWNRCVVFHLSAEAGVERPGRREAKEKAEAYYRRAEVPARCVNGLRK